MKKRIALLLSLVCLVGCGCDGLTLGPPSTDGEREIHTHEYEEIGCTATCVSGGFLLYRCDCGETKREERAALGHDFAESSPSAAHLIPCRREGCTVGLLPQGENIYQEKMVCTYEGKDGERIDGLYAAIQADFQLVGGFVAGEHEYESGSALAEQYEKAHADYKAFEREVSWLGAQYQYAQISYHVTMAEAEAQLYATVSSKYKETVGRYYGLFEDFYDSAYRAYFYQGMSEGEIQAYLARYSGKADEEVVLLEQENDAIELQFNRIENVATSDEVLTLYARLVENNNAIAVKSGYANYMEYAYASVYDRDYGYLFANDFYENVKEYFAPLLDVYYERYSESRQNSESFTTQEKNELSAISSASFFENVYTNASVNDFLAQVQMEKSDGALLSYGEKLQKLMREGNYFRGNYKGAYGWFIKRENVPILYFGSGYEKAFTVVHEFGHYMNSSYNTSKANPSYDLLETHSQGLEMLYLSFLKSELSPKVYELVLTKNILESISLITVCSAVNKFEEAVYTNTYEGYNAATIMADNQITSDEYDLLYTSICEDLGIADYASATYWRHVTLPNPGYYISYAVSLVCSLQLYIEAENEGLASAAESYLDLVTYTDENAKLTYKQVLNGAGLYAYDEERLFVEIRDYFLPDEV